ncbi:recombinase family protein [Carnobacteriaceae bacterium zg-ZUI78]|nr:recombinase family protein [Carnobacteriaceae bacterium zg-ZUI78]
MFDLTLSVLSQFEVAKIFNTKGYTTPMVYYKTGRLKRLPDDPEWSKSSISNILTKPTYTGKLVQGVKQQNLAKGIKQHFTNKDEYIVFENAHEPIITEEEYQRILEARKERKDLSYFSRKQHDFDRDPENRFKGKIYSSYSGKELYRRMVIYGKNKDKFHYIFRNERSTGKLNEEPNIHIVEKVIDDKLTELVREFIGKDTCESSLVNKVNSRYKKSFDLLNTEVLKLTKKLEREEINLEKSYEKYKESKLSLEKYRLKREIFINHRQNYQAELVKLENKKNFLEMELKKALLWIENLYTANKSDRLSKKLIDALVDKIIVKNKNEFEIVFTFSVHYLTGGNYHE